MKYLLLIYDEEKRFETMSEAEGRQLMGDYAKFSEEIVASGHYKTAARLQPTAAATSVRIRDGKRLVTDGPFAETREQLGGYYLIEAKDLDEAIGIAAKIPSARRGTVEVRPQMEMGAPAAA
ncbi:MAG: YciI family protein [Acidobacteriia bacterium]|nr:YciI family protein [Terriglobia bacterium]